MEGNSTNAGTGKKIPDPLRFHRANAPLLGAFGNGWFAEKAEGFARFFGTPLFLGAQTLVVICWITFNATGITRFDLYPFILLNLAFSVQSAYAAPLILLAQTRQADRDKATTEADARHREDMAEANKRREEEIERNTVLALTLLEQNTKLTQLTKDLSERIEGLTIQLHNHIVEKKKDVQ